MRISSCSLEDIRIADDMNSTNTSSITRNKIRVLVASKVKFEGLTREGALPEILKGLSQTQAHEGVWK
ncbi:hypothetical protein VNO77_05366 [Canavalia gladiata]|uniref:Uncharacterized protein n=1 Tax=Canavalia gladiata TaxID=3824 RepID=A0AAN9N3E8_CANGL